MAVRLVSDLRSSDFVQAAAEVAAYVTTNDHPERCCALLSEAGALRAAANELRCSGSGVGFEERRSRKAASLDVVGLLARSLHGAAEFASYGGHAQLLKLLRGEDGPELSEAAETLLDQPTMESLPSSLTFAAAAAEAGVPFPTLRGSPILDQDEVVTGSPLLEYGFDAKGSGVVEHQCLLGRSWDSNSDGDGGGSSERAGEPRPEQANDDQGEGGSSDDKVRGEGQGDTPTGDSWCVLVRVQRQSRRVCEAWCEPCAS